jgi:hypothetical protein
MKRTIFAPMLATALMLVCFSFAKADTLAVYGNTTQVNGPNGPAWQLTSNTNIPPTPGYAGVYVQTSSLTVSSLTQLSVGYQMTQGTFGGGSPRFSLVDSSNHEAYIYFGTPLGGGSFSDPLGGAYGSTGNYASLSSLDVRVYSNGFGGFNSPNVGKTWAEFVAATGGTQIGFVFLDLDGGWAQTQVMQVNNFQINGTTYNPTSVPEPASMFLLGSGLVVVGAKLRSRRKAKSSSNNL